MPTPATLDILMITHNRPEYTRRTLAQILNNCDARSKVWVWHNGDHTETLETVREFAGHTAFHRLHVSPQNLGLRGPTNWLWSESTANFLAKVDDDCLLPDGWSQTLVTAHQANPELGIIGCWRFYPEDFQPDLAEHKICTLNGGLLLLRNCWVQGSGYVMKRECVEEAGLLRPGESFSRYGIRVALAGWENGWLFPFIYEDHMDDPRSSFCSIRSEEDFAAQRPLSAIKHNVKSLAEWKRRVRHMAHVAQTASPDPRAHSGWRMRIKNLGNRIKPKLGIAEPWKQ